MEINKYNTFLFESSLHKLINESLFIYSDDFKLLLDALSSNNDKSVSFIANFIKKLYNTNIEKLLHNYINVDNSDSGKISFYPDNKIKSSGVSIHKNILSLQDVINKMDLDNDLVIYNNTGPILYKLIYGMEREHVDNTIFYVNKGYDSTKVELTNVWSIVKKYDDNYNYTNVRFYLLRNINDPLYYVIVYVDIRSENNTFTPAYNINDVKSSSVKIGRFINKLVDLYFTTNNNILLNRNAYRREDFTPADIEKFVNVYSSEVLFFNNIDDFIKIVDGEDIKYWYNVDNYENNNGQLGNSCMRYKYCQSYFDIYTKNPDVCKLLILVNTNNKLIGRALLWTDTTGKKWIDRVYTNKDNYISVFNKWAKKNNYDSIYDDDDVVDIKVQIKKEDYSQYPYMDSLIVYSSDEGILYSNREVIDHEKLTYCVLQETNGSARYY